MVEFIGIPEIKPFDTSNSIDVARAEHELKMIQNKESSLEKKAGWQMAYLILIVALFATLFGR
jgi:hypothetical protein